MTREEAIKYIKSRCIGSTEERDGTQWSEAMWTAIEALQNLTKPNEDDLISRGDAVALVNRAIRGTDNKEIQEYLFDGLRKDMWSLPSADRLTGWIPVSERLPDLKTEVIYSFDGIVSTGYMTDRDYEGEKTESHWEDLESGVTIEPIAWMPLPPPYEGDDEHE